MSSRIRRSSSRIRFICATMSEVASTSNPGPSTESAQSPDDPTARQLRKRRLNLNSLAEGLTGSSLTCKVHSCGVKLKDSKALEWHYEGHCAQELEKLGKIRVGGGPYTGRGRRPGAAVVDEEGRQRRAVRDSAVDRIRMNREKRKNRIRGDGEAGLPKCPACGVDVDDVDFVEHFDLCLRTHEEEPELEDEDELDVDDPEGGYETYTWAGHTRVRATSLVDGGLRGAGFMTITKGDENAVLDIENDDEGPSGKGSAQYTDADVIVPLSESAKEKEERENLRQVLIGSEPQACKSTEPTEPSPTAEEDSLKTPDQMSEAELRLALAESRRENAALRQQVLCNICFDSYTKPVVSVVCWHVHCEGCWLRALGSKKLCPQCKIIIQPRDLRRVYL